LEVFDDFLRDDVGLGEIDVVFEAFLLGAGKCRD
jgi:hypothetical protein